MPARTLAALCLVAGTLATSGLAIRADSSSAPIAYVEEIKPLLAARCYACHGALRQEGKLRLDTAALAIRGGDSGPAIVPGDATASLLIERIASSDASTRMPPEGAPLEPNQIAALRFWIDQNAAAPSGEQPGDDPRDHWSFRAIARPSAPQVANKSWVRNPIDAFITQQHQRHGLTPQVEAPRETLVRRLFLDLVGLPPTDQELVRLDADVDDDWYERLVERLLDDPRHGERWARHWMDIWRYSDWWGLGEQLRNSQRHMWHWRDWIVESLNANTPYDEMVRQMLAADELHPADLKQLRATGFLARNYFLFNRNQWMDETVEHVCKAMLGLTLNCAKCHDHKYDPFSQVDFYRLRAFFEPYHVRLDAIPGETDVDRDGIPRVFDGLLDAPTYRFERGQENQPDLSRPIRPGVPEALALDLPKIRPVALPKPAWQPERQPWVVETYLCKAQQEVQHATAALATLHERLEASKQDGASSAGVVADLEAEWWAAQSAADAAQSELLSVEARANAMRTAWAVNDASSDASSEASSDDGPTTRQGDSADDELRARKAMVDAIKAERQAAVAKARHALAAIEWKGRQIAPDGVQAWEQERDAAQQALATTEQTAAAVVADADDYTQFVGAKWTPTRFVTSTADDPPVGFPERSTGRRTSLAEWITDSRNPLTARVAANHIWTRHMGTPLVATLFDFGRHGSLPSHPELLDWLAGQLIDSRWDMKHLHRLIVLSAAYRMSSSDLGRDANRVADPDNRTFWRRTPIRLESQVVRDSILSLAGTLDLSRGGPPVAPSEQVDSTRRSLYFFHSLNDRNPFLATFDDAPVNECYRRDQSIVPQQALALVNSGLVHDAARRIAGRLSKSVADQHVQLADRELIERAFYLILGMRAKDEEIEASQQALCEWRNSPVPNPPDAPDASPRHADAAPIEKAVERRVDEAVEGVLEEPTDDSVDRARTYLIWALLNHTDFVTLR